MPTYSYACTACGHRFDVQQSFSDAALTSCPECTGRLRKLFGNVGVVFKGSGFYRTDARAERSGRRGGSSGKRAGAPAAASATATSSDSSGSGTGTTAAATDGSASVSPSSSTAGSSSGSSGSAAPRAAAD